MTVETETITFVLFNEPLKGACSICVTTKCGATGWIRPRYRGQSLPHQIGRECADKMAALTTHRPTQGVSSDE